MEDWIKYGIYIIGGGSFTFGLIFLMLIFVGSPEEAQEVREIPNQINKDISDVKEDITEEGKNVISQLNEDRKRAIANEKDPNIRGIINLVYIYVMFIIISIFVSIITGLSQIKLK